MIPMETILPEPASPMAPAADMAGIEEFQALEFVLGREHFAIDLFDVREVVEFTPITPLPNMDPSIRGIIDLRGEITTIIDLSETLNLGKESTVPLEDRRIIVLDDTILSFKVGILVDEVLAVSTFNHAQIDRAMTMVNKNETHILGIIRKPVVHGERSGTELLIWIDIRQLVKSR
jgi:purine-binding chemotaxis protein CheW